MAKSDLRSIMANAKRLHDMIGDADNLPEWCQNKITIAEDYISTVANYLTAEMNESVADTLAQRHSDLRKKSGLPHPDYYKELGKAYDIKDDQERIAKQSEIKRSTKSNLMFLHHIVNLFLRNQKVNMNVRLKSI